MTCGNAANRSAPAGDTPGMTVITSSPASGRVVAPGPHLMAVPAVDRVVGVLFALTVALFLIGLVVLGL